MADNVKIIKVTDKQKKKRIIIQNKVYELMDDLELSEADKKKGVKSFNRLMWEEKFKSMSDIDFYNMMLEMKNRRGYCFSYEADSLTEKKDNMNVNKINKIAKKHGFKLREYVMFPHKNRTNPDNPVISKTPLPIIAITVKRLQQMLTKKNKSSSDTSVVNPVTGQVTNESKAARLSNSQTYSLMTSKQLSAVKEYLSVRADDEVAKRQMFKEIEQTGKAHLSNYTIEPWNKQSIQAMEVFLRSAGLYSNMLKKNTGGIKSKEDLYNEGIDTNKKDLSMYKMIVFGENHQNPIMIKHMNKSIETFRPNYILHELAIPEDIVSPKEARRRLNDKNVKNHLDIDITDIYTLGAKLNATIIGIDAAKYLIDQKHDVLSQFVTREAKMMQHIEQFFALPNVKIAVIVGDTHLRYFETEELGYPSPIFKKYVNNDDVLIIRLSEIEREINIPKEYKYKFKRTKIKNDEIERYEINIMEEKRNTLVGHLFIKYLIDKNGNLINFNNDSAKFIGIRYFDEFKDAGLDKSLIPALKEDSKFKTENYYILLPKNSNLSNLFKHEDKIYTYDLEVDIINLICAKI